MKIHVPPTGLPKILSTDKQAYRLYRILSGGKAEPFDSIVWADWDIYEYVAPTIGLNQKQTDVIVGVDANTRTFEVVDLTAQEIADNTAAKLEGDLQQAIISSAILTTEVFAQLNVSGALDASALSQKAKDEFATLTALVASYTP